MNYKEELQKLGILNKAKDWLRKNPPPKEWQADKYAWAYTEMPTISVPAIALAAIIISYNWLAKRYKTSERLNRNWRKRWVKVSNLLKNNTIS